MSMSKLRPSCRYYVTHSAHKMMGKTLDCVLCRATMAYYTSVKLTVTTDGLTFH